MTSPVRLAAVVLAAGAPDELARFWATALGWDVGAADGGAVVLRPADGVTTFELRIAPAAVEKDVQNRIHLDLTTASAEDQERTVAALLAAGGTHADVGQGPDETHVVLADPEGNELCVIEPANRFLASCPRLGAVNCDGTRTLGLFFHEALAWPLVWDQDEETAIQAPDGTGPKITWSGPPLMPRPDADRLHLHLAPGPDAGTDEARDHLLALGAAVAPDEAACPGATALLDVDGNRICLVAR